MKPIKSLFRTIRSPERKLDLISELPLEMSQLILRKLDPESLLRAAQVSCRWMSVCRSDPRLKTAARRYKNARGAGENFAESQRAFTTSNADENVRKNMGYCDLLDFVHTDRSNMEFFERYCEASQAVKVDFIAELPLEVSQMILRYLDPESLLSAAYVSRKWQEICKSDSCLRKTARTLIVRLQILKCFRRNITLSYIAHCLV
ncbi:hypothetical protein K0M31_003611 [Melipona bicolor]|uniref:F-box domain-containing protein n=1 Tax=Melipona bicolor TaxID=60889 RepID=A0AA40KPP9_9HYME|nr:hypothetical protein K0M31_003611 [Melipona bicolor]